MDTQSQFDNKSLLYTHTRLEAAVTVWWWKRGGGRDLPSEKESKLWWCQRERGEAFFFVCRLSILYVTPPPFPNPIFRKTRTNKREQPGQLRCPHPKMRTHFFFSLTLSGMM